MENSAGTNTLQEEKKKFLASLSVTIIFLVLIWIVWILDFLFDLHLSRFGVCPHKISGLPGILFMPYLHGNLQHIISNSLPAFILGTVLFNSYAKVSIKVIAIIQLLSGLAVWYIGREGTCHVGASAVIFGLASFLFFSGFIRGDRQSVAISFFVGMLYGGSIISGIAPIEQGISWEGHLSGAIAGFICAALFKNIDLPKKVTWDDDTIDDDDSHFFEKHSH